MPTIGVPLVIALERDACCDTVFVCKRHQVFKLRSGFPKKQDTRVRSCGNYDGPIFFRVFLNIR